MDTQVEGKVPYVARATAAQAHWYTTKKAEPLPELAGGIFR